MGIERYRAAGISVWAMLAKYAGAGAVVCTFLGALFLLLMFPLTLAGLLLVLGRVLAPAAIVCGAVGVVRILGGRGSVTGMGSAVGGLLAGLAMVGVWMWLDTRFGQAEEDPRVTQCRSSLRQIGLAVIMYAGDNGDWTPAIEPRTREIAKKAAVPAGCVLTFKDEDGKYKASGLGLLFAGRYMTQYGAPVLYCPQTSGKDEDWVRAFSLDEDEGFWRTRKPGPTDRDGVGELPGGEDVMISSYVLRYKTDNEWGAMRLEDSLSKAIVCDLLFLGEPGAVRNHEGTSYHVLFGDGSVRRYRDDEGRIAGVSQAVSEDKIENVVDKLIFSEFLDPLHHQDYLGNPTSRHGV